MKTNSFVYKKDIYTKPKVTKPTKPKRPKK